MWGTVPVRYHSGTGRRETQAESSRNSSRHHMPLLQTPERNCFLEAGAYDYTVLTFCLSGIDSVYGKPVAIAVIKNFPIANHLVHFCDVTMRLINKAVQSSS